MAYESLIEDTEIIQGDSSDIYLFTIDETELDEGFTASFTIRKSFSEPAIVSRDLVRNDGSEGYVAGSQLVFQLKPEDTSLLTVGVKYIVSVEIRNPDISYNAEVAQFKLKILPQGV